MKFISPSWDKIYSQCISLAKVLSSDSSRKFDAIIGVSRGGLALTRIISDLLDVQNVMITRCEYYSDLGQTRKRPQISQKLQGNIKGKVILLLDDVADSGESLLAIKKYVLSKKPKGLTVATLYVKPWTKMFPDFYVANTDAWIIFPWELYEAIKSLAKNFRSKDLNKTHMPEKFVRRIVSLHSRELSELYGNSSRHC